MIGKTQSGAARASWLFGVMLCVWLASLASTASAAQTSLWLREPAISPDGSRIAFRFEGQIWIAPTAGGAALPLTPSGFHSASPVWSPSGEMIAFASDRFGPMNIFVAPADLRSRSCPARPAVWSVVLVRPYPMIIGLRRLMSVLSPEVVRQCVR